jgi:hypothetical protein
MQTELIVLNAQALSLWFGLVVIVTPALLFATFALGRYSMTKWFEKHGAKYAQEQTRMANNELSTAVTYRDAKIGEQRETIDALREALRDVLAKTRASQARMAEAQAMLNMTVEADNESV